MNISAYELAQRFLNIKEISGAAANPQILAMLQLDQKWPQNDEVPWCSAFVNYVAWLLDLPRSKNLGAKSWLNVGTSVELSEALCGYDVVILNRGNNPDLGHVGFYLGHIEKSGLVYVLSGNHANTVDIEGYEISTIAGIRRLYDEL